MRSRIAICLTLLALAGASSMLTACNTTAGAGKDISATGQTITKGAEKLKP
jgi:predicted small secreted protein